MFVLFGYVLWCKKTLIYFQQATCSPTTYFACSYFPFFICCVLSLYVCVCVCVCIYIIWSHSHYSMLALLIINTAVSCFLYQCLVMLRLNTECDFQLLGYAKRILKVKVSKLSLLFICLFFILILLVTLTQCKY